MGGVPGVSEEGGHLGVPLDIDLEIIYPFIQRFGSFFAFEFIWFLESLDGNVVCHDEKSDTEHTGELLPFLYLRAVGFLETAATTRE